MSPATLSFSLSVEMSSGRAWEIDAHASCLGIAYPHKPPTCPLLPVVKSLSLSIYPVVIPLPSVSGSICTGKIIKYVNIFLVYPQLHENDRWFSVFLTSESNQHRMVNLHLSSSFVLEACYWMTRSFGIIQGIDSHSCKQRYLLSTFDALKEILQIQHCRYKN